MPKLNERLSHWDALNGCFCGRWQKSPKKGHLYERSGVSDGGVKFSRIFAGDLKVCEVCGYDLTREPMENLKAMTAKDWSGALVKGSCFYAESGWQLPGGIVDCEFQGCNLDNVSLPVDAKGIAFTACSRKRIITQNDRADWVCEWKTEAPIEPVDIKRRIREGENTDPAKLPVAKLTDEELKALEQKRRDERELAEAQAKVSELTVKLAEVAAPEAVK
jgi:hypothetical protein